MADLPISEENGQLPVTINDPTTVTNSAKVDTLGNIYVAAALVGGFKATYSAAVVDVVVAATPTDIFTIYGSATKTVRIVGIYISATQNTAAIRDIVLIKRSAINTGGTSTTVTAVPHDSNNAAATATVLSYTANPTVLGAAVGNLRTAKTDIPATNLVGTSDRIFWSFGDGPSQTIILRGTAQGVALNLNSVTSANNSFDIAVEWTEE